MLSQVGRYIHNDFGMPVPAADRFEAKKGAEARPADRDLAHVFEHLRFVGKSRSWHWGAP
jgi:hypothetical protein